MTRTVTFWRRVVQLLLFVVMLYGAFLIVHEVHGPLPRIDPGTPRTTLYPRDRILWVSGKESILHIYLPILACRFIAKGGVFKSCSLHVLSENITWRTRLALLLPHVTWLAILSFLFARAWCAWACPLGAVQDALTWVRQRLGIGAWHASAKLQAFFASLRQVLLWTTFAIAAILAIPALGGSGVNDALFLWYCQICPGRLVYPALGGIMPCFTDWTNAMTIFMTFLGWGFFGVFLVSFMMPRLWCRICAVGALLSYFNRGGLMTLEKREQLCTHCGTCRRVCPVEVERVYAERDNPIVTDSACTLCLKCVEACPEPKCLSAKLAGLRLTGS